MPMERFAITTHKNVDLSLILRGLFASAVVFWHCIGAYHVDAVPGWLNVPGRVSVWVFFGLSGYVIGHGFFQARYHWWGRGLGVYGVRRGARILPLFWLVTALAVLLALLLGSDVPVELDTLLPALFATQWVHSTYFVGVFWTLGLEIQFYIVAPVIAWVIVRSGRLWPLLLLASWLILWSAFVGDDRTTVGNLQHFLVGVGVAKAVTSGALDRILALPQIASVAAAVGLLFVGIASDLYHGQTFWGGGRRTLDRPLNTGLAGLALRHRAAQDHSQCCHARPDGARHSGLWPLRMARPAADICAGPDTVAPCGVGFVLGARVVVLHAD